MRDYIGVDLADAEHAVWVEDESGERVRSCTVPHTAGGLREFGRWLDERRAAGRELWAAIEQPEGRVVDFLLDHGVLVFPVNPKALDRARDRFRVSSSKSDPFDARVLATFLRTDHAHLQPLQPSSEAAQELKGLTRDYARHVRHQTRLLNQLTATLKSYYPRALDLCDDLKAAWARAFLRDYPTPDALTAVTERRWQRWTRAQRLSAERTAELWAIVQRPQVASTRGAWPPSPLSSPWRSRRFKAIARRSAIFSPRCRRPGGQRHYRGATPGSRCLACTPNSAMPRGAGKRSGTCRRTAASSPSRSVAANS